MILED
jgi:hypothetical protein